jgi:YgiT-type zinc finger domain-containing protein
MHGDVILESEGSKMMPFEKCPVCGNELKEKKVEKLLRGGSHTVSMKVSAEVCLHCGERLYSEEVVRSFEEIRNKLKKQDFSNFRNLGHSFTVSETWPNKAIRPTA